MKNIKYFVLVLLSLTLLNCSGEDDNGQVVYNGAPALNFLNQGADQVLYVISNTASVETTIKFGTLKGVSGTHTVKLVPDTENSTAVLGVDYEIVSDTDVLQDGEATGEFVVKFFKDPAIEAGKKAVFKLESASLPQAVYYAQHIVNIRLSCPVEVLAGNFDYVGAWYTTPKVFNIAQSATGASQITIENFWEDNIGIQPSTANPSPGIPNFVLSFNRSNFVTTFGSTNTGRFLNGRPILALPDNRFVSRFNPCTRTVTVYVRYRLPNAVGTGYTDDFKTEIFNGIDIDE